MSDIDRLYCTHCTFGTSALETATADNASKVLGYSVRASSLPDADRGRLRQVFRSIERLLSYDLPRDASAADKEACDASSAPRRLIFIPSLGDCQVVGQVCYRSHDTAGRPGSYFADLLVSRIDPRQPDSAWSPLDCLRLWAADAAGTQVRDWWCESEESLAARVAEGMGKPVAPAGLDETHAVRPAAGGPRADEPSLLHDDALLAFLAHDDEAGIIRLDTGGVIPPRWRQIPAAVRRELFARMLQWTIGILDRGRENVVLAAEPSVAALLFYGVCRLLPRKLTRLTRGQPVAGLGFSTYEPFPERPMTSLVATTFLHGDMANDLPAEAYQRSFACNTFRSEFKYGRFTEPQAYVRRIVDLFASGDDQGRRTVDELLASLDAMQRLTPRGLDDLTRVDEFVTRYVGGTQPLDALEGGPRVQPGGDEEAFRRERLVRLIEQGDATGRAAWPDDLLRTSIDWLGGSLASQWGTGGGVRRVLQRQMPGGADAIGQLDRLLNAARRPPDEIAHEAIASVAVADGKHLRLPECIARFLAPPHCKDPAAALAKIIRMIEPSSRGAVLLDSNHAVLGDVILSALEQDPGCIEPAGTMATVTEQVLCRTFEQLPGDAQLGLLVKHAALAEQVPSPPQSLAPLLSLSFAALDRVPPCAVTRGERRRSIEALQRWASRTRLPKARAAMLGHWKTLLDGVQGLVEHADDPANKRQRQRGAGPSAPIDHVVESLAEMRPDRRDKSRIAVNEQANPDPVLQERSKLLATALQAIRPHPSEESHALVMKWVVDRLNERNRPQKSTTKSDARRQLAVAVMVTVPLIAAVFGGAAWYGNALPDWMRGGQFSTEAGKPPENAEHGSGTSGQPGGEANKDAQQDAAPTSSEKPAAVVAEDDASPAKQLPPVDLKIRVDDGEAIVTWNGEATKGTQSQLVLRGPGLDSEPTIPLAEKSPAEHRWRVEKSGTYTAEIMSASSNGGTADAAAEKSLKSLAKMSFSLSPPSAPKVKSIAVDGDADATGGMPADLKLTVAIAPQQNLAVYGPKDTCNYVVYAVPVAKDGAHSELERIGDQHVSTGTFSLPLPAKKWPIEKVRDSAFVVTIETPQGTGGAPPAGGTRPDIARFLNRGWEQCRKKLIWPIRSSDKGGPAVLMQLPPGVDPRSLDLALFTPPHVRATLTKQPERESWTCSVGLAADKKGNQNSKQANAAVQAPPPLAEVGSFEFGRSQSDGGRPRLVFRPSAGAREDAHDESLKLLELCKLCVFETAPQGKARKALAIAQLLTPASVALVEGAATPKPTTSPPADDAVAAEGQPNVTVPSAAENRSAWPEKILEFDLEEGRFNTASNSNRILQIRLQPVQHWLDPERGIQTGLKVYFEPKSDGSLRLELECEKNKGTTGDQPSQVWRGLSWIIDKDIRIGFSKTQINAGADNTIIFNPAHLYWRPHDLFVQLGQEFDGSAPTPQFTQEDLTATFSKEYQQALAKKGYRVLSKKQPAATIPPSAPVAETLLQCHVPYSNHEAMQPKMPLKPDVTIRMKTCLQEALGSADGNANAKAPVVKDYADAIRHARRCAEQQFEDQRKTYEEKKKDPKDGMPLPDKPPAMSEEEIRAWDKFEEQAQAALKRITRIERALERPAFVLDRMTWTTSPSEIDSALADIEQAGGLEVIGAQRDKTTP